MKRIATIASIIVLAVPLTLFAGNGRGGNAQGGQRGIHTPGTGQTTGVPKGTPGGQRLRDGSGGGTGQKQQKRQGKGSGQQNGNGTGTCQNPGSN